MFANLRLDPQFQFFTELQSDYAIGKQELTPGAKCGVIIGFEPFSEICPKREVGLWIVRRQGNVLQAIEWFPWHARVRQNRPILLPAVEHD